MTNEDAIQWMRETKLGGAIMGDAEVIEACNLAIVALRAQQEAEKNEPLTLDELRDMGGEPVWVQSPGIPESGRWAIVAGVDTEDGERTLYLHGDFTCRDYGKTWLAYRHKPKED